MLRIALLAATVLALSAAGSLRAQVGVKRPLEIIHAEEAAHPETAVSDYSDFIIAHSPQFDAGETIDVAIAFFNRGILLTRLGRPEAAKRSYLALEDGFATSDIPIVRLQVAKGLVNLAFLNVEDGHYPEAIAFARKVDARYSGANDAALGEDGFDLQVLKALNDKADAYSRFGAPGAARSTCDDIFKRFKSSQGEAIRQALDVTQDIRDHIATVPYAFERAPAETPVPKPAPQGFVPKAPAPAEVTPFAK